MKGDFLLLPRVVIYWRRRMRSLAALMAVDVIFTFVFVIFKTELHSILFVDICR